MKHKTFLSMSPCQTAKLGRELAQKILESPPQKRAVVVGLVGDLGGGKTTFLKGFARGLGIKEKILSPTFIILKRFTIYHLPLINFYHIDCYRIKKPKEILDLGFKEIIADPKNIVTVEWADKIKKILPKDTSILGFKVAGKNKRKISIKKL